MSSTASKSTNWKPDNSHHKLSDGPKNGLFTPRSVFSQTGEPEKSLAEWFGSLTPAHETVPILQRIISAHDG
jgi:hypothetical protein